MENGESKKEGAVHCKSHRHVLEIHFLTHQAARQNNHAGAISGAVTPPNSNARKSFDN